MKTYRENSRLLVVSFSQALRAFAFGRHFGLEKVPLIQVGTEG
jgi:hypothetical protein